MRTAISLFRKIRPFLTFTLIIVAFTTDRSYAQQTDSIYSQSSPNKQLVLQLRFLEKQDLQYRVIYQQKEVISWSTLGFIMDTNGGTATPVKNILTKRNSVDETIPWIFGEQRTIKNRYQQLVISFLDKDGMQCKLETRIFDDNLAFRFVLTNDKKDRSINRELTSFHFLQPFTVYRHNQESVFTPTPMNDLNSNSDFPVVLSSPDLYVSINEANNNNYTKAVVGKGEQSNYLYVKFNKDTVKMKGSFTTPWRTLTFSTTAIGLCKNSDLLYKLNPPADPTKNYSWIKPGKLLRDMSLSTKGALDCIDFAKKMDFQYVMYDAGWYGKGYSAEFDKSSDPVKVVPEIDMPKVISYGKTNGIGLILYVNYVGLKKNNLDTLFTLYKGWGVKGLKFGFVNGLTQEGIVWLMSAVKKAQDYGFIIDVHDNYKPTGIGRTIPAWLTQEGVRGNENNPDAFHNTVLPFTRFLSGAADYTFCYRSQNDSFNNTLLSKKLQVSQAQQLALTVIFFSPLQSMLWYGRPAYYQKPEEIEFFKYVPTTWDQTIHLKGEIGQYIIVGRKKGNKWFLGTAVNDQELQTEVALDFLDKGKQYQASIYEDDGKGGIKKTMRTVDHNTKLIQKISPKGGEAIMIE